MSRKTMSFRQLMHYIDGPEQKGAPLLHNLGAAQTPDDIGHTLIRNAHLLPVRKNGNLLYHEILSFNRADAAAVTPELLTDLTRRYLELRAPYALGYARAHLDTESPHVHLLISANDVGSRSRLRLSKARFREIQIELERYQKERYPQLRHSLAQALEPSPNRVRATRSEQDRAERQRRQGRSEPTQKERLQGIVAEELSAVDSGAALYQRLLAQGIELYRRGQSVGIKVRQTGKRYRLRTLGLEDVFEKARERWRRAPLRLRALKGLERESRERSRDGPGHER